MTLGNRLADGVDPNRMDARLVDQAAWADYRQRQVDWLVAPIIAELTHNWRRPARTFPTRGRQVPGQRS
ncbi:MAG: hypothetical protein ABJA87_03680 [bacterium]